jgi:hypothetical protein
MCQPALIVEAGVEQLIHRKVRVFGRPIGTLFGGL